MSVRNFEEHKKIMAQIAELEKNSVNYFDVEKEFFLIDSNNLSMTQTRLYGYSIQATGIYEEDNLTAEAVKGLDGRGCYIYVEVKNGKITIKQDLNGCWGIYLFRQGDYFALSNSFFRLVDHIKFRYSLTVNRDYCNHLLANELCSHAYSETAVNEIQLIERNAILRIDIAAKNLEKELIDYREHTIPLDSEEGISILDDWVEFWGGVLRGIAQHTDFIQADLSGGFDTRIPFLLLINSGVDCSKIRFNSSKSENHTFPEDYAIASKIAERYKLKLNQPLPDRQSLNYSLADVLNIDFYALQTIHKHPYVRLQKSCEKFYQLTGFGGETIRGNWLRFGSLENFMNVQMEKTNRYSRDLSRELSDSMKNIIDSAFNSIREKYNIKDKYSPWLAQYLYQETRSRHHHGKSSLSFYFGNSILLSTAFDPVLRTVRLCTEECPDPRLLIAVVFTRYEPDLLKFPFQGKRSIVPETIAVAEKINQRFPRRATKTRADSVFNLQPKDSHVEKILASNCNNNEFPNEVLETCLKAAFESSKTYGLFSEYFNDELYRYAISYYEDHDFGNIRYLHPILGIARVIKDVEISQRNYPPYQDLKFFLEQDFCLIPSDSDDDKILREFSRYFTARLDIKLTPKTNGGDFQILSVSDNKAKLSKPDWFNRNGIGYVIRSYAGKLELVTKATVEGNVLVRLSGRDVRAQEDSSKSIPYWVDYTSLIVNEKDIFNTLTPVWRNKPYNYNVNLKANEELRISVKWLPHRSDT